MRNKQEEIDVVMDAILVREYDVDIDRCDILVDHRKKTVFIKPLHEDHDVERDLVIKWLRDGALRIDPELGDVVSVLCIKVAKSIEANSHRK